MKIQVKIKPGAKQNSVERREDGSFLVSVKAPAQEGRANEALIETLARHFKVPKSSVTLVRGASSRQKWLEIAGI